MQETRKPNKNKVFSDRLFSLQVFFAIFIGIFIVYLFLIQVLDIKSYRTKAKKQRSASSFVLRGNIYD